jgi:hypothetical protein
MGMVKCRVRYQPAYHVYLRGAEKYHENVHVHRMQEMGSVPDFSRYLLLPY